jgi:ribonuclease Z
MNKLPIISGQECIAALEKCGFSQTSTRKPHDYATRRSVRPGSGARPSRIGSRNGVASAFDESLAPAYNGAESHSRLARKESSVFEIVFLGTSAAVPTPERSPSATLIRHGKVHYLVDCGEGTYQRLTQAQARGLTDAIPGVNLRQVFFTHDHLDHLLGIGGLLFSMRMLHQKPRPRLSIFGGSTTLDRVRVLATLIRSPEARDAGVDIEYFAASRGVLIEDEDITISAFRTNHTARPCFGYIFQERPQRYFRPALAERLGVPAGPLRDRLIAGQSVRTPEGNLVHPDQVLSDPAPGAKLVITGDIAFTRSLIPFAQDADVLITEATFASSEGRLAEASGHQTPAQAATIAAEANVRQLCLTHIGEAYRGREGELLDEALKIFPHTALPADLDTLVVEKAGAGADGIQLPSSSSN